MVVFVVWCSLSPILLNCVQRITYQRRSEGSAEFNIKGNVIRI